MCLVLCIEYLFAQKQFNLIVVQVCICMHVLYADKLTGAVHNGQAPYKLAGSTSVNIRTICMQVRAAEVPAAKELLGSLVQLLPDLTTVDEHDVRMQGKLELLLQLISVLGSHTLLSNESQQLVQLLLTGTEHDARD